MIISYVVNNYHDRKLDKLIEKVKTEWWNVAVENGWGLKPKTKKLTVKKEPDEEK